MGGGALWRACARLQAVWGEMLTPPLVRPCFGLISGVSNTGLLRLYFSVLVLGGCPLSAYNRTSPIPGQGHESFFFVLLFNLFYTTYFLLHYLFQVVLFTPSGWIPRRCSVLNYSVIEYHPHSHNTPNVETIVPTQPTPD